MQPLALLKAMLLTTVEFELGFQLVVLLTFYFQGLL